MTQTSYVQGKFEAWAYRQECSLVLLVGTVVAYADIMAFRTRGCT